MEKTLVRVTAGAAWIVLVCVAPSGAGAATNCGSLTFHEGKKTATETDISVSGTTCSYATKVFLPKAALATPAAATFFETWKIVAKRLGGGLTQYTSSRGKVTISYRVKAG